MIRCIYEPGLFLNKFGCNRRESYSCLGPFHKKKKILKKIYKEKEEKSGKNERRGKVSSPVDPATAPDSCDFNAQ